jgi:hypothetical protein
MLSHKKVGHHLLIAAGLAIVACSWLPAVVAQVPSEPAITSDDFSNDSGLWTYHGVASRGNGLVTLLDNRTDTFSQLWFKRDLGYPFTVEFDAWGEGWGEAAIMMFYKSRDYSPSGGENNGFQPSTGAAPGYGIELDYYPYNGDPGSWGTHHVALIEDHTHNHVAYNMSTAGSFPTRVGWSRVVVIVNETHVTIDINGIRWLDVAHDFDVAYHGFGFCGGCNWNTMLFQIDNIVITEHGTPVTPRFPYEVLILVAAAVVVSARICLVIWKKLKTRSSIKTAL